MPTTTKKKIRAKAKPATGGTARTMARPNSVNEYLAQVPADKRRALQRLRAQIKAAAPDATEGVSYGMPTFKLEGRPLAYFGAAKAHVSLYALPIGIAEYARELKAKGFGTSKGTVRFTPEKPIPAGLVAKLVRARAREIREGAARGAYRSSGRR